MEGLKTSGGAGGNANLEGAADKGFAMKAEVSWNGNPAPGGYINFTQAQLDDLNAIRPADLDPKDGSFLMMKGKIAVKPEGFTFEPNILQRLRLVDAKKPDRDALSNTMTSGTTELGGGPGSTRRSSTGYEFGNEEHVKNLFQSVFRLPTNKGVRLDFFDPHVSPGGGGEWSIDFGIRITDINVFTSAMSTVKGPIDTGVNGKWKIRAVGIRGAKGNVDSNEIVVGIQKSVGQ